MAKDEKGNKARVRVFFGEIEGDNETIRDGLRSIAAAVNRTFQLESTTVRVLTVGSDLDHKQLAAAVDQGLKEAQASEDTPESEPLEADLPRIKPSRNRKAPTYSFVKDLDLRPDGQASLRQFYADKKPTDQQEKMTVILYYLYRTLGIQNVTTNHIYTGLKELSRSRIRGWLEPILGDIQPAVDQELGFLPQDVWAGTRGYIEKVCSQLNGCFQLQFYDAASVMVRRLVETLVIECYEHLHRESEIGSCVATMH